MACVNYPYHTRVLFVVVNAYFWRYWDTVEVTDTLAPVTCLLVLNCNWGMHILCSHLSLIFM